MGMMGSCLLTNCVLIEEKRWNTRLLNSGDTRSADFICKMTDIDDFSRDNSFLQVESFEELDS